MPAAPELCGVCFSTLERRLAVPGAPEIDVSAEPDCAAFVTWNTQGRGGQLRLRGCIGTFMPGPAPQVLQTYALEAAFEDSRFPPITRAELPKLSCSVTLLHDFEDMGSDYMAWEVGKHGIRIAFVDRGRRRGATYLPDVMVELGWSKTEALISLCHKAGWRGDGDGASDDVALARLGIQLTRYQGSKISMSYGEYVHAFRDAPPANFA